MTVWREESRPERKKLQFNVVISPPMKSTQRAYILKLHQLKTFVESLLWNK